MLRQNFYLEFNVLRFMPNDWQSQIFEVAENHQRYVNVKPQSVTSRESELDIVIPNFVVTGDIIYKKLPWLYELYSTTFLQLGSQLTNAAYIEARDRLYGVNLNILRGMGARYECHVDSNPLQGVLFVTSHSAGQGGTLMISLDADARGEFPASERTIEILPEAGKLVFFDARLTPHYVSRLHEEDFRITVAMNYYSATAPEDRRPSDLNQHLFGTYNNDTTEGV